MLHPIWQEYLLSDMRTSIDAGVDAFLIDELAYGTIHYPDFNNHTLQLFTTYLNETYTAEALGTMLDALNLTSLTEFDYAAIVRDALPANMTRLTRAEWQTWDLVEDIPLLEPFQRFLRVRNRDAAIALLTDARVYAAAISGRYLPISADLFDLTAPEALYLIDLLDYVDIEYPYMLDGYFPTRRAFSAVKLAQAVGKTGHVLSSLDTHYDIRAKGATQTANLYAIMIAEAAAVGGTFYVEEGAHDLLQDIDALAPFYAFPRQHPLLFEHVVPTPGNVCLLHLFETLDVYRSRAYRGLSNLLADTGYQYSVLFAAEPYLVWGQPAPYPAPDYPLTVDQLHNYSVVVVPELTDVTVGHAETLLNYTQTGGTLLAFATPAQLDDLETHRGATPVVNTLLTLLRAWDVPYGAGRVRCVNETWGRDYLQGAPPQLQPAWVALLTGLGATPEVQRPLGTPLSVFAHEGDGRLVAHFVNFDHNAATDALTPSPPTMVTLVLPPTLRGTDLQAVFYAPGVGVQYLETVVDASTVNVTLPAIGAWGVLLVADTAYLYDRPLTYPLSWTGTVYDLAIISNSTISSLAFEQPQRRITFTVTGRTDTSGYCNVTIPDELLGGTFTVHVDGAITTYTASHNGSHTTLAFEYSHSTSTVEIVGTTVIPEFHTRLTIGLLLLTLTVASYFVKRIR
jgi:hypothetical protein